MNNLPTFYEFLNEASINYTVTDVLITLDAAQTEQAEQLFKELKSTNIFELPGEFVYNFKNFNNVGAYLEAEMGKDTYAKLYFLINTKLRDKAVQDFMSANYDRKYIKSVTK